MPLLSKELFISTIESIRLQVNHDVSHSNTIQEVFKVQDGVIPTYDNSLLIRSLVLLLQHHYPKKDNHCAIEHYMFETNFGWGSTDGELITIEDLWYQINKDGNS